MPPERITLSELAVSQFRNLSRVQLSLDQRFNVISGRNGSGKTNLLEAIYMFSALRSFRTAYRRELIRQGAEVARLRGVFEGAAVGLETEIELSTNTKKIRKGGKEVTAIAEHFSELPMVLFHPANMALIQGGPKERRRFMDRALFQARPSYPTTSGDYQRALSSRNHLLKSGTDHRLLGPYNTQIATLGAEIVRSRRQFVEEAALVFKEAFQHISLGLEGDLSYKPDVDGGEAEIMSALEAHIEQDRRRGFTARGPHADDLKITISGMDARRFASQGQQRVAVLAMKIAETVALQNVTGRIPVMLLDDISSELDRDRNRELFTLLRSVGGQVFITTTHLDHVLIDEERADFDIKGGVIQ